jgi:hypothetical protein
MGTEYPISNKEYPMKKEPPLGGTAQALGYWIFLVGCWILKKGGGKLSANPVLS